MTRSQTFRPAEASRPIPRYELRVHSARPGSDRYEIWQMPCPATPQVKRPLRIGGLAGRNLELVQHRVLRRLAEEKIRLVRPAGEATHSHRVPERLAVTLGLMFRALAPLRSRENIRAVAEGIEAMESEEASYWLGMATHRRHPRRVLGGLRVLLTEPTGGSGCLGDRTHAGWLTAVEDTR
ncbi:MAG: hypothetical protein OXU74_17390 [Gemmatimonadota bacterium]|nr:hypothetical protein [Gemmatimonadota bacterium]